MYQDFVGLELENRYTFQALQGAGGMAYVFRAHDRTLNRQIAVKIIKPDYALSSVNINAAITEARIVANLKHHHIVTIFDQGVHVHDSQHLIYIVMQYASGGALIDRLQTGSIALDAAERVIAQVGEALDFAHSQGIIHLDVKPHNILFNEQDKVLVTDFGLARMLQASSRVKGQTGAGTPAYMAPEQFMGSDVGSFSDVYGLGITLHQMLTGNVTKRNWTEHAGLVVQVDPTLAPNIRSVIARATQHDPGRRFSTVGELARAFSQALDTPSFSALPTQPVYQPPAQPPTPKLQLPELDLTTWWGDASVSHRPPHAPRPRFSRRKIIAAIASGFVLLLVLGVVLVGVIKSYVDRSDGPTDNSLADAVNSGTFRDATLTPTFTPLPTKTLIPSRSAIPATATVEPSSTPSATPTASPTPSPTPFVEIVALQCSVRTGPGEAYPELGQVQQGYRLPLWGRSEDGYWWQVDYLGWAGWVPVSAAETSASADSIPVVPAPPPPSPSPTPTPTAIVADVTSRAPTSPPSPTLQNPVFSSITENNIPGWHWWAYDNHTGGDSYDPASSYETPLIKQADDPPRMIDGATLQIDAAAHLKFQVYVFQTVNANPGAVLRFRARAGAYTEIENIMVAAGIDPDGGYGCASARWGEMTYINQTSGAVWLNAPDTPVGPSGRVTVCLYAEPLYPAAHNAAFFDNAQLTVISR